MKEEDLTILDANNQFLDLPSKDNHHHTSMFIFLNAKNNKNSQSNQFSTEIIQIVITPSEPHKTEQQVVSEKIPSTKASETTIQTNEIKGTHDATSQEDIVLMDKMTCLEKQMT